MAIIKIFNGVTYEEVEVSDRRALGFGGAPAPPTCIKPSHASLPFGNFTYSFMAFQGDKKRCKLEKTIAGLCERGKVREECERKKQKAL